MDNPGLLDSLWQILDERLWHATGPEGLCGIVKDKEIKITGDRYQGSLCRFFDCVSLFDFGPTAVDESNQYRNWSGWFGHPQVARVAIWLEIDRHAAGDSVIDAKTMLQKWACRDHREKTFIPGVEAGHKGAIPICHLRGALLIDDHDRSNFVRHNEVNEALIDEVAKFEKSLPPAPPQHLLIALNKGRQRLLQDADG